MFLQKKFIPRRTFLKGAGVSLGLPLLDAMVPAMAAESRTAAAPVRRLGFIIYPLGVDQDRWRPKGEGSAYTFSEALAPLQAHRNKFVVFSGLSSDPDRTKAGFHDRALASFLTGVEPTKGKVQVGISVDQLAAQSLGKETPFASLEISTENNQSTNHIGPVFKSATTPLPFEFNPRRLFERLFGEGDRIDPVASAARDASDRSSLDSVTERITELKNKLGAGDRRKLDEYVESIRDVERRIQVASRKRPVDLPEMSRPAGVPDSWPDHVKLMFDLQALALQADLTRVWTFLYAREATSINYPHLDITMGHHEISHHNFEKDKLDALAKINVDQSRLFAYFLDKLEAIKEGNSTLLDHSLLLYGSNLSVPTSHSQRDLPIIVAGGAAGRVAGGRYVSLKGDETPLTNLYLTMLDKVGVPTEKLGDSTGSLNRLEV
ncbi:MAG TPA: DUF1552 domain-containing protein [Bryobacteraceae bacterium]|nr:DUF1552 domain-containing protein [Bryobacteraceae bacterium]